MRNSIHGSYATWTLGALLLICPGSWASGSTGCAERREFKIEGVDSSLCFLKKTESWASPSCAGKKSGNKACGALQLVEDAREYGPLAPEDRRGGKNPGSVLCAKLGGTVLFATLKSGSQISFCKASDASMIDCNTIHSAWASVASNISK